LVLVLGHPVGALAETSQVGREHDVPVRRERVRVGLVVAGDPAHRVLPGPVPVDGEHRGTGRAPVVRDEQVRGHRHRGLAVEHDVLAAVRTGILRREHFDLQRHRRG
jgi:hypothetical protein